MARQEFDAAAAPRRRGKEGLPLQADGCGVMGLQADGLRSNGEQRNGMRGYGLMG
jgi:hypothetical protein